MNGTRRIEIIDGPQSDFLNLPSNCVDCLFGGSAGGSKSYSLVLDHFLNAEKYGAYWNSLLVRKNYPQLDDIHRKCVEVFGDRAKWQEQKKMFVFHNGARVRLGHMQNRSDHLNYQGHEYTAIGVDELPQWAVPDQIDFIRSRLRSTHPDIVPYFRGTANPGGPGSRWVADRYKLEEYPSGYRMFKLETDDFPEGYEGLADKDEPQYRVYIPARLKDNPYLMQNANYLRTLQALPDKMMVRALLEGDWSALSGTFFNEFNLQLHVVEDFPIPQDWEKAFGYDYGYSFPAGVYVARDPIEKVFYVYDCYEDSKVIVEDQGKFLRHKHMSNGVNFEDIDQNFADPSIFAGEPPTIYDRFLEYIQFQRGINNRIYGWNLIRALLQPNDKGKVHLKFFKNKARPVYSSIKNIPRSPKNPDDLDTDSSLDHQCDSLRYLLATKWFLPGTGNIEEIGISAWRY